MLLVSFPLGTLNLTLLYTFAFGTIQSYINEKHMMHALKMLDFNALKCLICNALKIV